MTIEREPNEMIQHMVADMLAGDLRRLRERQAFYFACAGSRELTTASREASAVAGERLAAVVAKLEEVRGT